MAVPAFVILHPRRLLATLTALLMAGNAWAETAGRVNFVTGSVVAVQADNTRRTLARGDMVNSGERIETAANSRIQIRFTDNSFLALQANSTFTLEKYSYSAATPEQGTLLFNFLRGSMRTISGAIGKVNRNNYQIHTNVATIGIRGTDYAGVLNNDDLLLHVNKGAVNMSNAQGNADVPAGQTFEVKAGQAPVLFTGAFPAQMDEIAPDVEPPASAATTPPPTPPAVPAVPPVTPGAGVVAAAAGAGVAAIAAGIADEVLERPRLENYATYNDFLQAMYAYKKAEAERLNQAAQPVQLSPELEQLTRQVPTQPEMSPEELSESVAPSLVIQGGETIEEAIANAKLRHLPLLPPNNEYNRSTYRNFPMTPEDAGTLEQSSVDNVLMQGFNVAADTLTDKRVIEFKKMLDFEVETDVANKSIRVMLDSASFNFRLFGNTVNIDGFSPVELQLQQR